MDFPGGSDSQESACNAGDLGLIPGLGRSPGRGHSNPPQYSCLQNPHGQRSLAVYRPWGCKESDTTERLSLSAPPGKPLGSSILHKNTPELRFPQRTAKEKRKRLNFWIDFYLLQENGRMFTKLESTFSGTVKTLGNTWLVREGRS